MHINITRLALILSLALALTAAAQQATPGTGQTISNPTVTVSPANLGGPIRSAGGNPITPATQPAQSAAEKAIEKYLQDKGGTGLTGRLETAANDSLKTLFPDHTFTFLTIPRWPVARPAPAPLAMNNIFAVDAKGNVTHMTTADDLQKFFAAKITANQGDDQAKAAAIAWATLTVEFLQDGMFTFTAGKPEIVPPADTIASIARIVTTVNPRNGDSGDVTSTITIDATGKFTASDKSTLKAGIRPICQSTKLLDPDPLVRRMAEQDLLIMGETCFWYLDAMREQSPPDLQRAIDDIKVRILRNDRIEPRTE